MSQHMEALARANEIRLQRAALLRQVKNDTLSVVSILKHTPECMDTCTIYNVLRYQRGWGKKRTVTFLARLKISQNIQLQNITVRQNKQIRYALKNWKYNSRSGWV